MGKLEKKKILAVASAGGHWIQLKRLKLLFEKYDTVYVTTNFGKKKQNTDNIYYVTDASRWNKFKLIKQASEVLRIIAKERPDIVISTGASPGLWAILFARFYNAKTIWLDSLANTRAISMSGKLIKPFVGLHLTQWPNLEKGKTKYKGSVIQ